MRPEELVARARRYERELRRIESERREMRERIDDAYWRGRQDERRAADGQPATATVLDDATSWLRTSLDSGLSRCPSFAPKRTPRGSRSGR